jgi:gliding motility-associated lipoprotein GldH
MNGLLTRALCLLAVLISLTACDPRKITDEYHTIRNSSWNADSVQHFSFTILKKDVNHNIYFNVRNDRSYEFSNLWLFVTLVAPDGKTKTDTVQLVLSDPSGKWLGKGFSGIYDNRLIYRKNVYFPDPGPYAVHIRHGMRPTDLKGITDIGIRVEKVN